MPENAAAEGGFGRDAPSRPDENDRGGQREKEEAKAAEAFERSMDNAERPDRAPATPSTISPESDDDDDGHQDDRGFLDRAGDFLGGITRDVQDVARENPRVDSHGNTVGLVDADGIQHGDVASRVMSSGTSDEDLAGQLGFASPQDMAAAQNTDFIEDKLQEGKSAELLAALEERYGRHPDLPSLLQTAGLMPNLAPNVLNDPNTIEDLEARRASVAFGDIEYVFNGINTVSAAEVKLQQGDIDGYYEEIGKIDPYGDLALDVRQQHTPGGVIAEDYYRDTLRKEGFTDQQIDDFWARDTRALTFADLAVRKAEFGAYDIDKTITEFDGILSEERIAHYHERAMGSRYDNWTGKVPYEALGRWMATTPEARVQLANDMVALARSDDQVAQDWVDEVIGDWDTVFATPGEALKTLPDSLSLVGPAISGIIRNQWDAFFGDDDPQQRMP